MANNILILTSSKKILFLFLLCTLCSAAKAQSLRQKGHFFVNQQSYTPSSIAFSEGLTIHGNYRGQWFGVEGAPQEQELAASIFLPEANSAAGFTINNEIIGAFRTTTLEAQYAYRLKIKESNLAFGLSFGFENSILKGDILTTPEQTSTQLNTDPYLPLSKANFFRPLLSFGVSTKFKGIQIDVALNNVLNSSSKIKGNSLDLVYKKGSVLRAQVSYSTLVGKKIMLNPGINLTTDFNQNQASLYVLGSYKSLVHFGLMYRGYNKFSNDALIPILGIQPINTMKIFYSYEATLSGLNKSSSGTHEVSITYNIPKDKIFKKGKVFYNPRFL